MLLIYNTSQVVVWNVRNEQTSSRSKVVVSFSHLYDLKLALLCCQESWGPSDPCFLAASLPYLALQQWGACPTPLCCAAGRQSHLAVGETHSTSAAVAIDEMSGSQVSNWLYTVGCYFDHNQAQGQAELAERKVKRAWGCTR